MMISTRSFVFVLFALALGVLLVSKHGSSVDLMHLLFGSVLPESGPVRSEQVPTRAPLDAQIPTEARVPSALFEKDARGDVTLVSLTLVIKPRPRQRSSSPAEAKGLRIHRGGKDRPTVHR